MHTRSAAGRCVLDSARYICSCTRGGLTWGRQSPPAEPTARTRPLSLGHQSRPWRPTGSQHAVRCRSQATNAVVSGQPSGIVLLGFPAEEVEAVQSLVHPAPVVTVQPHMHVSDILGMLAGQQPAGSGSAEPSTGSTSTSSSSSSSPESEGRLVYLVGSDVQQQYGGAFNDILIQSGWMPAVVGALQPRHQEMSIASVRDALRVAHARYWGLIRPATLAAPLAEAHRQQAGSAAVPDALAPLQDARVVLSVIQDAGRVPSPFGGWRDDAAHMVALDGLMTEAERQDLLEWLTAPGHDHSGPPPKDKWEMSCVDREGDQATWGLQPHMLQALEERPPSALVALQTRLAALYPEYVICHMPADVLSVSCGGENGEEEEEASLSVFVGNAVMQGDPCAWHDDADPATFHPASPWVPAYGLYYNREPGRPRFVSLLLYLNESWPEDLHAETLYLDPAAQAGVFVRPRPGRVVLMDQDMPHRISAPSAQAAGAPRYSLVWKMVWVPRGDPLLAAAPLIDTSSSIISPTPPQTTGLCRPEWGEPVRFGSAGQLLGRRAWPLQGKA